MTSWRLAAALALFVLCGAGPAGSAGETPGWSHYGGDPGGQRFSAADQITPANVDDLTIGWEYRTGDLSRRDRADLRRSKFQATPILFEGSLLLCSPFNEVIALDPATGQERWRFDPKIPTGYRPANLFNCRGVAAWTDDAAAEGEACRTRVFTGTNDGRIVALDARTGGPCAGFGDNGAVRVDPGMALRWPGEFQITSAPVVARGVVIVGSAIGDNARVEAPKGTVRAFDARTGAPRWTWDPLPPEARHGHANVWAPMSVDEARGLVFLPTSSPSPDFFGGLRAGQNGHANSVVALDAETGVLRWSFRTVNHDVWDYDLPAQPTLSRLTIGGVQRDVVIQGTKQGFVFVLDRDTGAPVLPVEERPVPQGGVPGEVLSPTQPYPADLPPLVPHSLRPEDGWGFTPWDAGACRDQIATARSDGLYTPPSLQGTVMYPFTGGGVNLGGIAVDPRTGRIFANTSRLAHLITLFPAEQYDALRAQFPNREVSSQRGAPYAVIRDVMLSPLGLPCTPPPWGAVSSVDLESRRIAWEVTHGTTEELAPLGLALPLGTPTVGGPIATAGGLVFIGAAFDKYLRAYDAGTGEQLWAGRLPFVPGGTPMTYVWEGRQYVVVTASGRGDFPSEIGDAVVAFRLPSGDEPGRSLWGRTIDQPGGRFLGGAILAVLVLGAAVTAAWRLMQRPI